MNKDIEEMKKNFEEKYVGRTTHDEVYVNVVNEEELEDLLNFIKEQMTLAHDNAVDKAVEQIQNLEEYSHTHNRGNFQTEEQANFNQAIEETVSTINSLRK